MYSGFMNHAVPLWVSYVNKRSTNVSHLVNTQNAIPTDEPTGNRFTCNVHSISLLVCYSVPTIYYSFLLYYIRHFDENL